MCCVGGSTASDKAGNRWDKGRGKSRSKSAGPPSPEDLPTCDVSTHPFTEAERLSSRQASPSESDQAKDAATLPNRAPSPEADSSREEEVSLKALQE